MVIVFEITEEGVLTNVSVPQDAGTGTRDEGIRVFKNFPKLKPALNADGMPVRFTFNIPLVLRKP